MLPNRVIEAWLRDIDIEQVLNRDREAGSCVPGISSPLPTCAVICPPPTPIPSASSRSTAKKRASSLQPNWRSRRQRRGLTVIDANIAQQMDLRKSPRKKKGQGKFMFLDENTFAAAAQEENEQEQATPRPLSRSRASGKSRTDVRSDSSPRCRRAGQQDPTGFDGTVDITPGLQLGTIPEFQARKVSSDFSVELKSIGVESSAVGRHSRSQSSAASSSTASRESVKTKRSRSPVKGMSDLQLADKPIKFGDVSGELPLDVADLYEQLKDISDGIEIVPASIKASPLHGCADFVQSVLTVLRTRLLHLAEGLSQCGRGISITILPSMKLKQNRN